jgi:hypothetical protein
MIHRCCPAAPSPLQAKFQTTRTKPATALIEQKTEIDLVVGGIRGLSVR